MDWGQVQQAERRTEDLSVEIWHQVMISTAVVKHGKYNNMQFHMMI